MPTRTSLQVRPRWTPSGRSDYRRARRVAVAAAPRYLPGVLIITSPSWIPFGVITREHDVDDWAGLSITHYLEVTLETSAGAFHARARLFNITDGVLIGNSAILTLATTPTRVRSLPLVMPTGSKTYRVDFGGIVGATYICYSADVIVEVA